MICLNEASSSKWLPRSKQVSKLTLTLVAGSCVGVLALGASPAAGQSCCSHAAGQVGRRDLGLREQEKGGSLSHHLRLDHRHPAELTVPKHREFPKLCLPPLCTGGSQWAGARSIDLSRLSNVSGRTPEEEAAKVT